MKSWYQSKTIWFNVLTIIFTTATYFGYVPDQDLATTADTFLLIVVPFVNVVLRSVTNKSIR